jgi:hypothetical protein
MAARAYNLKSQSITINGVPLSEFGDTDALSVAPEADLYTSTVTADGTANRSRTNDNRHTATLTLKQNGVGHLLLMQTLALQEASTVPVPFAFVVRDIVTGERLIEPQALIRRRPDIVRGRDVSDAVWTIDLPSPQISTPTAILPAV